MNQFYRTILATPRSGRRLVCCCVEGDLHEMGLRIVANFVELEGWDCDYVGANTASGDLVATMERAPPDLIAVSATMTYHVEAVRELIRRTRARPTLAGIPVLVGGRPFLVSDGLWRQDGADDWASHAEEAVAKAARWSGAGTRVTDGQGLAAVCDEHGVVREVIRDTLGFAICPGVDITGVVDADDRDKCRRFLTTALSRQAAFDWSLNVPYRARVITLHFGAANMDGQLVIIAAEGRTDLARLSLELARDTKGATAQLRRVRRESARQLESRADHDAHLYDELTGPASG